MIIPVFLAAGVVTVLLEGGFFLLLVYLLSFHSFLILTNTTTWECLSWNKVSYLRDWPRKLGSPFNIGCSRNVKLYFCYNLKKDNYFVWRMPK